MAERFKYKSVLTDKSVYADTKHIMLRQQNVSFDMCSSKYSSEEEFKKACEIVRKIVVDAHSLKPVDLDALYSAKVLERLNISRLVNFIVSHASDEVAGNCAFNAKKILFYSVFPKYYNKNMKGQILAEDIINAKDTLLKDFKSAAKSKDGVKQCRTVCRGSEVDKIVFNAIKSFFSAYAKTDKGIMKILANPSMINNSNASRKFGFSKIIEARGCYQNDLDFYFLNMPLEDQEKCKTLYRDLRQEYYEPDLITEILNLQIS